MGYELNHEHNKISIRKPPYKRYTRVERTFGEEYSRESILFRIKHTPSFKVPFPEFHTLTGRYTRKNKTINKIVELKGKRENLWRKHTRVKTDKEKQFICFEIGNLAKQIDELKKDITIYENIQNRALKMREDIKENDKKEIIKTKNKYLDSR